MTLSELATAGVTRSRDDACCRGGKPGQRLGSIRIEKEFDAVLMVLLDEHFDALEIYEADRQAVIAALSVPGSRARNERGALAVSKFKSIGHEVWQRPA